MRRIGLLFGFSESDREAKSYDAAFRQKLAELGWSEGRNVRFDHRWAAGDIDRIRTHAAELVALSPDAILATNTTTSLALRQQSSSIPIVFAVAADPVGSGLVATLARPGGNITGFENYPKDIGGKWLDLLRQVVPGLARVAVMQDAVNPATELLVRAVEVVSLSVGMQVTPFGVRDAADIERFVAAFAQEPKSGLIVLPGFVTQGNRETIVALAARHSLPVLYPYRSFITAGGLMSYGTELVELYRQAATYVARLLKGEKVADLPVQAPTKLELVVNLKAAKALGLTINESFLLTADEVIE
jgi:putative ABC transport system substrate-binding protein